MKSTEWTTLCRPSMSYKPCLFSVGLHCSIHIVSLTSSATRLGFLHPSSRVEDVHSLKHWYPGDNFIDVSPYIEQSPGIQHLSFIPPSVQLHTHGSPLLSKPTQDHIVTRSAVQSKQNPWRVGSIRLEESWDRSAACRPIAAAAQDTPGEIR